MFRWDARAVDGDGPRARAALGEIGGERAVLRDGQLLVRAVERAKFGLEAQRQVQAVGDEGELGRAAEAPGGLASQKPAVPKPEPTGPMGHGGDYVANALLDLYPQMARDYR